MFSDKRKIQRAYLEELTKMGNLFDTLKVDYCVIDSFALISHGILSSKANFCKIVVNAEDKAKTLKTLYKLNYTICELTPHKVRLVKQSRLGELSIDMYLSKIENKTVEFSINSKVLKFPTKYFFKERKEVIAPKGVKGYFKVASLEALYFLKMNSENLSDRNDLEIIKGSGKMDFDKLLKIFSSNGLV